MSRFTLTEAYSEIYNPKNVDNIFDNLRFVDYMQDEEIQSVIEELVWEFRDYGHTMDEAFDLIDYALQDEVICESYEELASDILYEATVTKGMGRAAVTSANTRPSRPGAGTSRLTFGKGGSVTPSGSTKVTVNDTSRFNQGEVQRRANRIGRIKTQKNIVKSLTGPIRSVKQAISGSAAGMGRAAKELGGKVAEKGKSLLKGLLRRGGKAASNIGRNIESRGKQTASAGLASRQAGNIPRGGGQGSLSFEPTTKEKAGKTGSGVGRAIRAVGAKMQRAAGRPEKRMTRNDYDNKKESRAASTKASVGTPFASSNAVKRVAQAAETVTYRRKQPTATAGRLRAPETSDERTTRTTRTRTPFKIAGALPPSTGRSSAKIRKDTNKQNRELSQRLGGTSGPIRQGEKVKIYASYEPLLDAILEDLIYEGYANNLDEALYIIENISEEALCEITEQYLAE